MSSNWTVYADDPDAHVVYPITEHNGAALNFTPVVKVGSATEVTAAWSGAPTTVDGKTVRNLDVPLTGIPRNRYRLRLKIPGDNDLELGSVLVR